MPIEIHRAHQNAAAMHNGYEQETPPGRSTGDARSSAYQCRLESRVTASFFATRKTFQNKKVLLRERKRHTAHRVVSTPSFVLTGYPPPVLTWPGGVPCWGGTLPGYPQARTGGTQVGYPLSWPGGYPARGYPTWVPLPGRVPPILTWPGGYPIWVPPILTWQGTPQLDLAG